MLTHHAFLPNNTEVLASFTGFGADVEVFDAVTIDGRPYPMSDFDRAWIENEIVDQAAIRRGAVLGPEVVS